MVISYRTEAALILALSLSAAGVSNAQSLNTPPNTRDGCVSGSVEPSATLDVDLFTVPAGMEFVLTDIQYDVPGGPQGPQIVGDAGELRWVRLGGGGTVSRSWVTGIRFAEGKTVRARFGGACCNPYPYTVCWTGYVVRTVTSAVVGGEGERLGFRIGPNPTKGGATLWFQLDHDGPIKLAVYDSQGRLVRALKSGPARAGEQSVRWDGRDKNGATVQSGLYFARLEISGEKQSAKIVRVE